jgi:tRNA threonylcarbamoyladenosine modification (KEOPS) complex Cgi121 subunit
MIWWRANSDGLMEEASPPWFSAWSIKFSEPISDPRLIAAMLLQKRKDERWLLVGHPAPVSERHLWSVWLALRDRALAKKMISVSLDGEFIRLLAGTHQMSVAFKRAGVQVGDEKAWLIRLPEWDDKDDKIHLNHDNGTHNSEAYDLMSWLEAEYDPERPTPTNEALNRLQIESNLKDSENTIEEMLMTQLSLTDID